MSITNSHHTLCTPVRPRTTTAAILLIFSLMIVALAAIPGTAQYQWERQGPFSVGNDLKSITFVNPATGFAVGVGGTVLRTTDGGSTWERINSGTDATLNCIYVTLERGQFVGLIGCSDGSILRSTDWGSTWQPDKVWSDIPHAIFAILSKSDRSFLAVGAYRKVYVSSSGWPQWKLVSNSPNRWISLRGITSLKDRNIVVGTGGFIGVDKYGWQPVQSPAKTTNLYGIGSIETTAYICGESGMMLKTIDSGSTWQKLETGCESGLTSVAVIDENTVCTVGDDGTVLITYNGGATWTKRNIDTDVRLTSVYFTSPTTGHIVGDRGMMAVTMDGGVNWKTSLPVWSDNYRDVSFATPDIGWALDRKGVITNTIDGGTSWTTQVPASATPINALQAMSPDMVYACGGGGLVLRSTTGGQRWMTVQTDTKTELLKISGFVEGPTIAIGSGGTILRSAGNGMKMMSVSSGVTSDLLDVYMADPRNGWIVGRDGVILGTTDGGAKWTRQSFIPPSAMDQGFDIRAVTAQGPNVIAAAVGRRKASTNPPTTDEVPVIVTSSDSGATWSYYIDKAPSISELVSSPDGRIYGVGDGCQVWTLSSNGAVYRQLLMEGSSNLSAVSFAAGTGYAVGDTGCIFKSVDNSFSWKRIRYRPSGCIHGVSFTDDLKGWAAGDNGLVLQTSDGGSSWKPVDTEWSTTFRAIDCLDPNHVWMVSGCYLYSTKDAGASWNRTLVSYMGSQLPTRCELSCVDFINPTCGWIGARGGNVFHTINGGQYWSYSNIGSGPYNPKEIPPPPIKKEVKSLSFVSPTTGWAVGADGLLARTTDGGVYWTVQKDPASRTYNDFIDIKDWQSSNKSGKVVVGDHGLLRVNSVYMAPYCYGMWDTIDTGTWNDLNSVGQGYLYPYVVIAGDNGTVIVCTDRNKHLPNVWKKVPLPVSENLNAAVVTLFSMAFVFGDNGIIMKSPGYDYTWWDIVQTGIGADFRGACGIESNVVGVYACGTNGVVIRGTGNGMNWTDCSVDTQTTLNSIAEYQGKLITVGDGGAIFVDTGNGWEARQAPTSVDLTDVAIKDGVCYIVGKNGTLLIGTPFTGSEWTLLPSGTQNDLKSVDIDYYPYNCWIAGANSTAMRLSIPVDITKPFFSPVYLGDKHDYNSVQFIDLLHGWAVGDNGIVISTQDGGANWTWKYTGIYNNLSSIKMLDSTRGIAAGENGTVLVTTDAGNNWSLADVETADNILGVAAGQTRVWIAGENGVMLSSKF